MLFQHSESAFQNYKIAFAFSAIPAFITIAFLFFTKYKFPHPEEFESSEKTIQHLHFDKQFVFYIIGISFFAFGFFDYSLIALHITKTYIRKSNTLITTTTLPLLYALAMIVDAISAVGFGLLYDKRGMCALVIAILLSSPFVFFVFAAHSPVLLILGIVFWGIGLGAEESILKAVIAKIVPKEKRATGYGVFEFAFGIFLFLGSWFFGALYDVNMVLMMILSFASELFATLFFFVVNFGRS